MTASFAAEVPRPVPDRQKIDYCRDARVTIHERSHTHPTPGPSLFNAGYSRDLQGFYPIRGHPDPRFVYIEQVIAKIKTDSTKVEEPKDPDKCIIYNIYKLLAASEDVKKMRKRYLDGGLSWKEAKDALSDVIINHFAPARDRYNDLMNDKSKIQKILRTNAEKAKSIAAKTIERVRSAVGII